MLQVRVKKGYVPPEEQQTYDRWKNTEPQGVPGAYDVGAPKPPKSKTAMKNEKRKQKKAEGGTDGGGDGGGGGGAAQTDSRAAVDPAAQPAAGAPAAAGNEIEKKVRALRKRLRMIDDLAEKAAAGAELNADQAAKVASRGEVEAEIAKWEALNDTEELGKEVKKLNKKMRQIEELEARAKGGETLNADQEGKIAAKAKVAEELKKMEELASKLAL